MRARSLASGDRRAAIEALVEAFDRDPLAWWLRPDAPARRAAYHELFSSAIAAPEAVVDLTCLDGVAIWHRPGEYPAPSETATDVGPAGSTALASIEGNSALWTGNEANLTFYARFGYRGSW